MKADQIARFLPETYRAALGQERLLDTLLVVMETMHAPADAVLDGLDSHFDPRRTPDRFVPYLASWLDLDRYLDWPGGPQAPPRYAAGLGRLRELTALAAELGWLRGTSDGLLRFLEAATGLPGFAIEENPPDGEGAPRPFHLRVRAPPAALEVRDLVYRVIEAEKPAHVTSEVEFEEGRPAAGELSGKE